MALGNPLLSPLGDRGLLVQFASTLSDAANAAALALARRLVGSSPAGVTEIVPNLVSVLLKYDPTRIAFEQLAGEVRLLIGSDGAADTATIRRQAVVVRFDGEDLPEVAKSLGMSIESLIAAHNAMPLRVLAVGFAPGFVYCGLHPEALVVPRRATVRAAVPAGTVLFAAGQTAIAATTIPTGWHVIGHTEFRNFDPGADPPTRLRAGDEIVFEVVA